MITSLPLHVFLIIGFCLVLSPLPLHALAFASSTLKSDRIFYVSPLCHHRHQHHHSQSNGDRRSALRRIAITASTASLATSTTTKFTVSNADAITPQQASTSYDTYAANYNVLDGGSIATSLGIDDARKQLLSQAYGNVLEIGVGTGLNLDSYRFVGGGASDGDKGAVAVTSLTLVDISEGMLAVAKARAEETCQSLLLINGIDSSGNTSMSTTTLVVPSIKFVKADATSELISLFGENSFDTVVDTFSLCVMGNEGARKCLREMTGVLKQGGACVISSSRFLYYSIVPWRCIPLFILFVRRYLTTIFP
jgi:ubiquinone/menaquinone biosynthesis C-methylase UbiE